MTVVEKPGRRARLRITEIFHSLQGESRTVGLPTVFVRLTGCPLRCQYCDTAYAFHGGELRAVGDIVDEVGAYDTTHVTVTGGEPLAQPGCLDLLSRLADAGHQVSIETSGAMDVAAVDPRVVKVMDIKTPGSRESTRNRSENLQHLTERDQVRSSSATAGTTTGRAISSKHTNWPNVAKSCSHRATSNRHRGKLRSGFWPIGCRSASNPNPQIPLRRCPGH